MRDDQNLKTAAAARGEVGGFRSPAAPAAPCLASPRRPGPPYPDRPTRPEAQRARGIAHAVTPPRPTPGRPVQSGPLPAAGVSCWPPRNVAILKFGSLHVSALLPSSNPNRGNQLAAFPV